jgi:2-aminobenzoylacetyl-CoA thioesterase
MIQESSGKISEDLYALGCPEFPSYLRRGKTPVLFDSGPTFMGPRYVRELKVQMGDSVSPAYLFLTHSHYDHAGSAPFLKRNIPDLKVGAGKSAAEIFQRPSAIRVIQDLSREMEEKFGGQTEGKDVIFRGLELDLTLGDGDEIFLEDGTKIEVIATPGHTRDSVSYYLPASRTLFCGEAVAGLDRKGGVRPTFLSSYRDHIASLKRLQKLDVRMLLMGHYLVFTPPEAQEMVSRSIEAAESHKNRIEKGLALLNGDREALVQTIFQKDFVEDKLINQEENPFLINLRAQVKAIAEGK